MGSTGTRRGPAVRLVAALASVALVIAAGGMSGCGSDKKSPASASSTVQNPAPQPAAGGTPREQVAGTANAYLSGLNDADGAKVCAQLTEGAKADFIGQANEAAAESRSCEDVTRRFAELYLAGQLGDTRVGKVRVNGNLASAEGPVDVPFLPSVLRLAKERGRWLILDGVRTLRQSQAR